MRESNRYYNVPPIQYNPDDDRIQYNPAFRHENLIGYSSESIRNFIISYLGEYRLEVPRYTYELILVNGQLVDSIEGRSLVKQGENAIELRLKELKSIVREEAELQGLKKLEEGLKSASLGNIIIWCSPPGPKEDGYGEYGFIYLGQVADIDESGNKKISMNALRVERPIFDQFNQWLSELVGVKIEYYTAEEFLANPIIYSPNETSRRIEIYIESLSCYFTFNINNEQNQQLWQLMEKINPFIEMYIQAIKNGDFVQAKEIFNTIENLAVAFKNPDEFNLLNQLPYMSAFQVIEAFKYLPPPVAGSCGTTSSLSHFNLPIQNLFPKLGIFSSESINGERYPDYECPHCGKKIEGELKNDKTNWKTNCPHCGYQFKCHND